MNPAPLSAEGPHPAFDIDRIAGAEGVLDRLRHPLPVPKSQPCPIAQPSNSSISA